MPAVVTFWQMPEDEQDFLDFLQTTGTVLAIPDHRVKTAQELVPEDIALYVKKRDPDQLLFGLCEYARSAPIEAHVENGERIFGIAYMSPCLISYRRGRLRGRRLSQSNLAAYWDYPNEDATAMVSKDPEFIKWAKKVFEWARRRTPEKLPYRGYDYRATRRAAEEARGGRIEPIP